MALPTRSAAPAPLAVQPRPMVTRSIYDRVPASSSFGRLSGALPAGVPGSTADPGARYNPGRQTWQSTRESPYYGQGYGYNRYDPLDPRGLLEAALGGRGRDFFESGGVDPGLTDLLRLQAQQEGGDRLRNALLGLSSRGADLPGSYGVAALMAGLGSASDLSRAETAAQLQQAGSAQTFRQNQISDLLQFLRQLEMQQGGFEQDVEKIRQQGGQQRKTQKAGKGGLRLGADIGPISASYQFATGGVVDRPTQAIIGEDGPEAVVPFDRLVEALLSGNGTVSLGRDLIRARAEAAARGRGRLTGGAMEGPADQTAMPVPFSSPEPPRPEGWRERFAAATEPWSTDPENLLSLFGGGWRRKLESHRRVSDFVDELNQRQRAMIPRPSAGRAAAPRETVYNPTLDEEVSPSTSDYEQRLRLRNKLSPPRIATPRASKQQAGTDALVSDIVRRLDRVQDGTELRDLLADPELLPSGVELTTAQKARLRAARQAAQARMGWQE